MSLLEALVVPGAPLLVPEIAAGSASADEPMRSTVRAAVTALLALGDWLVDDVDSGRPRSLVGVGAQDAAACARCGAALVRDQDVRLLVVGDGSACRSGKAPGHLDPRAEPFDAVVERAVAEGDAAALLALPVPLAEELFVSGRAPAAMRSRAVSSSSSAWWPMTVCSEVRCPTTHPPDADMARPPTLPLMYLHGPADPTGGHLHQTVHVPGVTLPKVVRLAHAPGSRGAPQ